MYMDLNSEELYTIIDRAIDEAMLNGRFLFNMKSYLTGNKWTRKQTKELIDSLGTIELISFLTLTDSIILFAKFTLDWGNLILTIRL